MRREQIARPALVSRLAGERAPHSQVLRRNVAQHALRCPQQSDGDREFRQAQRGPRLEGPEGQPPRPLHPAVRQLLESGPPGPPAGTPPDGVGAFLGEVNSVPR